MKDWVGRAENCSEALRESQSGWKGRFRTNQDSCNQASVENNPGRLSVRLIPKGVTARKNLKISLQGRSERCMPMDGTGGERKHFRKRNNTAQEMETHSWNLWSWISSWAMSHLQTLCLTVVTSNFISLLLFHVLSFFVSLFILVAFFSCTKEKVPVPNIYQNFQPWLKKRLRVLFFLANNS